MPKAILFNLLAFLFILLTVPTNADEISKDFLLGIERQTAYLPKLQGKRVGLVVNQSSMLNDTHLVDHLLANQINVVRIFAPEHGFRGDHDAGAKIDDGIDSKTGLAVISIYGEHKKPQPTSLKNLDVIVFDIQDVGARFYTYISSMHYMMEAAAENDIEFMVLDRPNPNGKYVDGPIREEAFTSFVGMHPIPILHGMTVAELAQMIKGEGWINQAQALVLHTVKMQDYHRDMDYSLPISPSPNLPNDSAIQSYASLCLFEPTVVSIGRGTDFPFQVVGHDKISIGDFAFMPRSIPGVATHPKLQDKKLKGIDLREQPKSGVDLQLLFDVHEQFSEAGEVFFTSKAFFDKLAGTDKLRKALEKGESWDSVKESWQPDLKKFKQTRAPYLLY